MTLKNKERKQIELDLTTIAYNIKLTHNHKMNLIKQKNKESTSQAKNFSENQISKTSMEKPACMKNIPKKIISYSVLGIKKRSVILF